MEPAGTQASKWFKKKINCDYESVFPKKTLLLLPDASSQNDFSLANFFGLGPIITVFFDRIRVLSWIVKGVRIWS